MSAARLLSNYATLSTRKERPESSRLDLSEVYAIEGGGLGMLVFLQRWADDHEIRFKLFNPSQCVRDKLEHANPMREFEVVTLDEMMAVLACGQSIRTSRLTPSSHDSYAEHYSDMDQRSDNARRIMELAGSRLVAPSREAHVV